MALMPHPTPPRLEIHSFPFARAFHAFRKHQHASSQTSLDHVTVGASSFHHNSPFPNLASLLLLSRQTVHAFLEVVCPKIDTVLQLKPYSPSLYGKVLGTTLPFIHPSQGLGLPTNPLLVLMMEEHDIANNQWQIQKQDL